MKTKYQPQISEDLMRDIFRAHSLVKGSLKNKRITAVSMGKLIRSWQGELGSLRRKKVSEKELRGAELALGFLKKIHDDNMKKYESYYMELTKDSDLYLE